MTPDVAVMQGGRSLWFIAWSVIGFVVMVALPAVYLTEQVLHPLHHGYPVRHFMHAYAPPLPPPSVQGAVSGGLRILPEGPGESTDILQGHDEGVLGSPPPPAEG